LSTKSYSQEIIDLGIEALKAGDTKEALRYFNDAQTYIHDTNDQEKTAVTVMNYISIIYYSTGREVEANSIQKQALILDGNNPEKFEKLVTELLDEGRDSESKIVAFYHRILANISSEKKQYHFCVYHFESSNCIFSKHNEVKEVDMNNHHIRLAKVSLAKASMNPA